MRASAEIVAVVVAGYALLLVALIALKPEDLTVTDALRIAPDTARLIGRLARSRDVPWTIRAGLLALVGYLAMPIDIVPDVIPVVGAIDDVVIVVLVLRAVIRHAGAEAVLGAWPGSTDGLRTLERVLRLRAA